MIVLPVLGLQMWTTHLAVVVCSSGDFCLYDFIWFSYLLGETGRLYWVKFNTDILITYLAKKNKNKEPIYIVFVKHTRPLMTEEIWWIGWEKMSEPKSHSNCGGNQNLILSLSSTEFSPIPTLSLRLCSNKRYLRWEKMKSQKASFL